MGKPDSEYGRQVNIQARSALEAGLIVLGDATRSGLIPLGYVAHSLVDEAFGRDILIKQPA